MLPIGKMLPIGQMLLIGRMLLILSASAVGAAPHDNPSTSKLDPSYAIRMGEEYTLHESMVLTFVFVLPCLNENIKAR
jgi:hypothetical protein